LKVSVITVTYNSAATVEDTIRSVSAQSYPDIEYIVVDGASTDKTINIINRYRDDIQVFVSEKDRGLYDALNKAIALATGDIVGILHSDDLFAHKDVIAHYVDRFLQSGAEGVYADLDYVDRKNTARIRRKWRSGKYRHGMFKFGWMPPHPTFMVKRALYKHFGAFNTSLRSAADYELMLRFIHLHKIRLVYMPEVTIKMRAGGKSNATLQNRVNANREDRLAWKMNGLKAPFYTLYLKPLRKIFQFF
jgi:glycosyltransferase involved in cell wall biosynthesis